MRRIVGLSGVVTLLVVAAWRGASELLERRGTLAATGELDQRVALRRRVSTARALTRAGLAPPAGERVHASLHVGRVRVGDVDDVGLLEAAMRRAVARREFGSPEGAGPVVGVGRLAAVPLALAGMTLTLVPLVRPLSAGAPWLALAGAVLVLAAWMLARRA